MTTALGILHDIVEDGTDERLSEVEGSAFLLHPRLALDRDGSAR